jgi:hypothetical protein
LRPLETEPVHVQTSPAPADQRFGRIVLVEDHPRQHLHEIYRAKVAVQGEITRRAAYEELLALEAKLAKLPPLPAPPPATANDDS